ncbi:hypothetical protein EDC04DRAFT_2959984 [Pisolithus marmoratus]|nr:hypothetical protein EDC04DRAFT_2959984 [Pisolithus marmoratus]
MPGTFTSVVQFSHIRATKVSKYQKLRVQVSLDGEVQESQESILDDSVHEWREPFSFRAHSSSQCEIHLVAKKNNFFCWSCGYKTIRKTRPHTLADLFDANSNGMVKLPLFDSKADKNGVIIGHVIFMITNKPLTKRSNTRDIDPLRVSGTASVQASPFETVVSEKLPSVEAELELTRKGSHLPPPEAPTLNLSPLPLVSCYPLYASPQLSPSGVPSPDVPTPQHLVIPPILPPDSHSQSPQSATVLSLPRPGVDQLPARIQVHGDAGGQLFNIAASDRSPVFTHPSFEQENLGAIGNSPESATFTGVLCEPPDDFVPDVPCAEPQDATFADPEPATFSQVNIIISSSSRRGSPLSPSGEPGSSSKRPHAASGFLHVNTGATSPVLRAESLGRAGEYSPATSPHPTASTSHTSDISCLSPFSRTSVMGTPSTAATSPSSHSVKLPNSPARQHKQLPKIDTSCAGPRGQVRKYTVPPVTSPTKLRNASLDLPRHELSERLEYNPSMYSIAPSVSSRNYKTPSERCPSTQRPASRQGFQPSPRAPSVRREQIEYDVTQICLDTASLNDQEVAAFLQEVDAALSAMTSRSAAVSSDGPAYLSVPNTGRASGPQSRRSSRQHLRGDFVTHARDDLGGAARTTCNAMASVNQLSHPDGPPSRFATPLLGPINDSCSLLVPQDSSRAKLTYSHTDVKGGAPLIFVECNDEEPATLITGSRTDNRSQGMFRAPSYLGSQGASLRPPLR